jgi:hypothetical protein
MIDRLIEIARVVRLTEYVSSWAPPHDVGIGLDDAAAAVREVREAS